MKPIEWQKMFESGVKLEYFSRFHQCYKPVLASDNIHKLAMAGYQIREVK